MSLIRLHPIDLATIRNAVVALRIRIETALTSSSEKELLIMTTLADIKASLDALKTSEEKLEAFAVATQASLTEMQAKLADAQSSSDPAALQAIADQIAVMQGEVAAVVPAAPAVPVAPVVVTQAPAPAAAPVVVTQAPAAAAEPAATAASADPASPTGA